jgi:hypothetical protein
MTIKPREVYTGKYYRHGTSFAVHIPPDIRELAGLVEGDTMLMNYEFGIIWMVKAVKHLVFDRKKVSAIFDKLFPDKVDAGA